MQPPQATSSDAKARRRSDRLISSALEPPMADDRPRVSSSAEVSHQDIERRAYELYCERGRDHGRDLDDWLAAERELIPS